jgi:hypothetical protein
MCGIPYVYFSLTYYSGVNMMFIAGIIESDAPRKGNKFNVVTEAGYFDVDRSKLQAFRCPQCKEHNLFRGCVYIGCTGCMSYFSEKEIIEENLESD